MSVEVVYRIRDLKYGNDGEYFRTLAGARAALNPRYRRWVDRDEVWAERFVIIQYAMTPVEAHPVCRLK